MRMAPSNGITRRRESAKIVADRGGMREHNSPQFGNRSGVSFAVDGRADEKR